MSRREVGYAPAGARYPSVRAERDITMPSTASPEFLRASVR